MENTNKYVEVSPSRYDTIKELIGPVESKTSIVEFGCGSGMTLLDIKKRFPEVDVIGFDLYPVTNVGVQVLKCDLNNFNFDVHYATLRRTDVFLLLDVLEHLIDPWSFLSRLISTVNTGSQIVIICPNFASVRLLVAYCSREIPRDEFGFFDKTHLRWLTASSLLKGLDSCNLSVSSSFVKSSKPAFKFIQGIWPSRLCSQFILKLTVG